MRDVPRCSTGCLGRDNRKHANDRFALLMSLALYGQVQLCSPAGQRLRTRRVHPPGGATASAARLGFPAAASTYPIHSGWDASPPSEREKDEEAVEASAGEEWCADDGVVGCGWSSEVERLTVTAFDWLDVVVCPPRNELTLTCAVSSTDGGWFFRVAAFKEHWG